VLADGEVQVVALQRAHAVEAQVNHGLDVIVGFHHGALVGQRGAL
jgi:hypothetical protein